MTSSAVAQTDLPDSRAAGIALAAQLTAALDGGTPDAVVVFASPIYDYAELLDALRATSPRGRSRRGTRRRPRCWTSSRG